MNRRDFLKGSTSTIALLYFPEFDFYEEELFPFREKLKDKVDFWVKVFTEYNSDQFIVHDLWDLDIIYDVIDFPVLNYLTEEQYKKFRWDKGNGDGNSIYDYIIPLKEAFKKRLNNLANDNLDKLDEKEKKLHLKLKRTLEDKLQESNLSVKEFYKQRADNVAIQWAQADRTKAAFERSGMYTKMIEDIFKENEIPLELKWLPIIESGFDNDAVSSKEAKGIWQFTRVAAREEYLGKKLSNIKDPKASTIHAAGKLKSNYNKFKSWPLAMMAYHHGIGTVNEAYKKFKDNVADIIFKYKDKNGKFGFASRNYYPEFLAVLEIANNIEKYYGNIAFMAPIDFEKQEIKKSYVYKEKEKNQIPENGIKHVVEKNESLWTIAKDHSIDWNLIREINEENIQPGDIVYIPGPKTNIEHKPEIINEEDYFMYTPKQGDSLEKLEKRFKVTREEILKLNPNIKSPKYEIYVRNTYKIPNK